MSIDATHWGRVCATVEAHAKKLHPRNPQKQRELVEELLCITSRETMIRRGQEADSALRRMGRLFGFIPSRHQ